MIVINLVITVKRLHQGYHFDKLLKTLLHVIIPQCDTKGNRRCNIYEKHNEI
jgi:hypothetical protein